jgi:hypothetical protein
VGTRAPVPGHDVRQTVAELVPVEKSRHSLVMGKIQFGVLGGVVMRRPFLVVTLLLLTGALVFVVAANRYQYFTVAGPSLGTREYAQMISRRVDRWTGKVEVWACQDVDTAQVANVPPAPKPSDYDNLENTDSVKVTGQYFVALNLWRKAFPHVNPENLHVTRSVCGWGPAQ